MRSLTADDSMRTKVPWSDVVIDVQGPYTRAEGGDQYVLSYHCLLLRVPKLQAFASLKAAEFSRALVSCILRTRVIPDIVRSDRGPEMTRAINQEFLALLGIKHVKGAAFTPRHQGPGERAHQTIMNNHLLLMNEICRAFTQEWASLVPALEYLCDGA